MACFKTLNLSAASVGDLNLQDATYVSSLDKIFAVSGVHMVQLNADTGAVEASVRISSPVNNGARIVYHAATGLLYASVWNEPNLGGPGLTHPNKDVYPIDPETMTVQPRLDIVSTLIVQDDFDGGLTPFWGPRWLGSRGNYLYIQWNSTNFYDVIRVNPTNLADRCTQSGDDFDIYQTEQISVGPTHIVAPDPNFEEFDFAPIGWNNSGEWDFCAINGFFPVACEYCDNPGLHFAVDGNGNLFRINDLTTDDVTVFDLTANPSLAANVDPCRLRYRASNGILYLPCMTANAIILWNAASGSASLKTGFENPVDVVFTGTKAWAVQNSPEVPLKEIL